MQRATGRHTPICGTPQIRTGNESPVWAVSGDLLLVAIVTVDRPTDKMRRNTSVGGRPPQAKSGDDAQKRVTLIRPETADPPGLSDRQLLEDLRRLHRTDTGKRLHQSRDLGLLRNLVGFRL